MFLLLGCQQPSQPAATDAEAASPAATGAEASPAAIGSTPADAVPLPVSGSSEAGPEALVAGVLRGDGTLGAQGCMWVEESGSEEPISVLWPEGYQGRFDPIELLDGDGQIIAREGELIELAGGDATAVETSDCRVSTRLWAAWQVTAVTDSEPPR